MALWPSSSTPATQPVTTVTLFSSEETHSWLSTLAYACSYKIYRKHTNIKSSKWTCSTFCSATFVCVCSHRFTPHFKLLARFPLWLRFSTVESVSALTLCLYKTFTNAIHQGQLQWSAVSSARGWWAACESQVCEGLFYAAASSMT